MAVRAISNDHNDRVEVSTPPLSSEPSAVLTNKVDMLYREFIHIDRIYKNISRSKERFTVCQKNLLDEQSCLLKHGDAFPASIKKSKKTATSSSIQSSNKRISKLLKKKRSHKRKLLELETSYVLYLRSRHPIDEEITLQEVVVEIERISKIISTNRVLQLIQDPMVLFDYLSQKSITTADQSKFLHKFSFLKRTLHRKRFCFHDISFFSKHEDIVKEMERQRFQQSSFSPAISSATNEAKKAPFFKHLRLNITKLRAQVKEETYPVVTMPAYNPERHTLSFKTIGLLAMLRQKKAPRLPSIPSRPTHSLSVHRPTSLESLEHLENLSDSYSREIKTLNQ
jgi:hypothetical protein